MYKITHTYIPHLEFMLKNEPKPSEKSKTNSPNEQFAGVTIIN